MSKIFVVDLVSTIPFNERNAMVVDLIQRMLSSLKINNKDILECQHVWSIPSLPFPFMVKYNDDAMKFVSEYVRNRNTGLYGISDWDEVKKGRRGVGAHISIRVRCSDVHKSQSDCGYGISFVFSEQVAKILFANGLVDIVGELARIISADIGRIDYTDYYYGGGILSSESMAMTNQKEFPCEHDLTGLIPGVAWWTLLSELPLEKLGGADVVVKQTSSYKVHHLGNDTYQALALQLTPNPFVVKEKEYAGLRLYLRPVLPPVNVYALAYALRMKKIPLSRIKQLVTQEELVQAKALCALTFDELIRKSISGE